VMPIRVHFPGTLQTPPMTLEGPVVDTLPTDANMGDCFTWNNQLVMYLGDGRWAHYDSGAPVAVSDEPLTVGAK